MRRLAFLAVAEVVFLTVGVLLAEVDPEVAAVVGPALEAETAVAVHWASVGVDPETAVGVLLLLPCPWFWNAAAVVSVVAPVFVALPVSVYFLPEFWQRLFLGNRFVRARQLDSFLGQADVRARRDWNLGKLFLQDQAGLRRYHLR